MQKWIGFVIAALIVIAYSLNRTDNSGEGARVANSNAEPGYGGTIVIGVTGDVDTFNPLYTESTLGQQVTHLMLLGLADLDDKSEFTPELASHWTHSDDNTSLTWHLRKDAVWSDGHPVTADDVAFTFDLLMDSTVASPRQSAVEYIKSLTVVDAHTVRFDFKEPYPGQLFDTAGELLPKHILADADRASLRSHPFSQNPLSSGPFVLKKWVRQQYIELAPNPKYFGRRPYLDRIVFKVIPDETNLLMQLQTGEIDMMVGVPLGEVPRLQQKNPRVNIYRVSGRSYYYLGYETKSPLFSDARVRRAMTMALDREGIIKALLNGYGKPSYGPIPPMIAWAYSEDVQKIPFDRNSALALLQSAGWKDTDGDSWLDKDGKPFEFTLLCNTGNQIRADLAVIAQDQLRRIGVKVNIKMAEWTTYLDMLRNSDDVEAWLGGWGSAFNVDPTPVFHSSSTSLFNYGNYSNPEIDKLIESGRVELDRTKAVATWRTFQRKIFADQPYTFLFWIDKIVAVDRKFKNVTPIPLSAFYDIENWYTEEQAAPVGTD